MPEPAIAPRPKLLVTAAQWLAREWASTSKKPRSLEIVVAEEFEYHCSKDSCQITYTYRKHIELLAEYILIHIRRQQCTS